MSSSLYQKDILQVTDFTLEQIEEIMVTTQKMRELGSSTMLSGKVMTALFYEPSSRTFGSFISAMQRLGGGVIPLQGVSYSSVVKGETLEDTVATFSHLSDIIVFRHPQVGSAKIAAGVSQAPVINAGDGIGEHPTQALLDLFTIRSHFPDLSKITITFVGDLKNGRTVHSLNSLISLYHPKKVHFISPPELAMEGFVGSSNLEEVLPDTDVLYMTRVQKERFSDPLMYEQVKDSFCINNESMEKVKKTSIVMHPFPRVSEISPEVDSDPRAVYLREQISNGLFVRMALLSLILTK